MLACCCDISQPGRIGVGIIESKTMNSKLIDRESHLITLKNGYTELWDAAMRNYVRSAGGSLDY